MWPGKFEAARARHAFSACSCVVMLLHAEHQAPQLLIFTRILGSQVCQKIWHPCQVLTIGSNLWGNDGTCIGLGNWAKHRLHRCIKWAQVRRSYGSLHLRRDLGTNVWFYPFANFVGVVAIVRRGAPGTAHHMLY